MKQNGFWTKLLWIFCLFLFESANYLKRNNRLSFQKSYFGGKIFAAFFFPNCAFNEKNVQNNKEDVFLLSFAHELVLNRRSSLYLQEIKSLKGCSLLDGKRNLFLFFFRFPFGFPKSGSNSNDAIVRSESNFVQRTNLKFPAVGGHLFKKSKILKLFSASQRKYPPKRYYVCERPSIVNSTIFMNPAYTGENIRLPVCPSCDFSYLQFRHPFYPNLPPPLIMRFEQHMLKFGFSLDDSNNTSSSSASNTQTGDGKELKYIKGLTNEELYSGPINFDYLLNTADIMKNKRFFGDYKNKYFKHPVHGHYIYPNEVIPHIVKYNLTHPEKAIPPNELLCDIIKCRSDGVVVELKENTTFFDGEGVNKYCLDEPRFFIQATPGYIKKNNLTVGKVCEAFNKEQREKIYDNHFRLPKAYRNPILLPNNKVIL